MAVLVLYEALTQLTGMLIMANRQRTTSNSAASKAKALQLVKNQLQPTRDLSVSGLKAFQSIIDARERSTWTDFDLHQATLLAVTIQNIDSMYDIINTDGWLCQSPNGSFKRHPAAEQLDKLYIIERGLMVTLGLTAAMRKVSGQNQAGRNDMDQKAQTDSERADDSDGLLA